MGPTEAACVQIHSHASQLNCSQNVPLSDLMHISGETMWPESLKCWPEKLFGISFKFHHIYKAHTALCSHYFRLPPDPSQDNYRTYKKEQNRSSEMKLITY